MNTMKGHTPGPWRSVVVGKHLRVETDGRDIAMGIASLGSAACALASNARLIAAAPELLAACKAALPFCPPHVRDMARVAIEKAKRGTP